MDRRVAVEKIISGGYVKMTLAISLRKESTYLMCNTNYWLN